MTNPQLPYIYIDDEFEYNLGIVLLLLNNMGLDKNELPKLDLDKIQIFMYLIKNPAKINRILMLAGKKSANLDEEQIYTIESMSVNLDILYDKNKIKDLIKGLSVAGLIEVHVDLKGNAFYFLNEIGKEKANQFDRGYFSVINCFIKNIESLSSLSVSSLFRFINFEIGEL